MTAGHAAAHHVGHHVGLHDGLPVGHQFGRSRGPVARRCRLQRRRQTWTTPWSRSDHPRNQRRPAVVGQRGQATVEFALALPVVVCVLLAVIQVALVARSQILVTHAAREAARQMAVDPDEGKAAAAARATPGLDPRRVSVDVGPRGPVGSTVAVTVTYQAPTDVPLVGALFGDPELRATVSMRVETGPDVGSEGEAGSGPGP